MVLVCVSLITNEVKHRFICLLATQISFFCEMLVQISCPFSIGLFMFFLLIAGILSLYIYLPDNVAARGSMKSPGILEGVVPRGEEQKGGWGPWIKPHLLLLSALTWERYFRWRCL